MLNKDQLREMIDENLEKIDLYSEAASDLVYNTGLVESKYVYLKQVKGPARGLFQCDSHNAVDICLNYLKYRDPLMKKVAAACRLDWSYFMDPTEEAWKDILTYNLAAQICMCRLHWRRVPKRLPTTIEEQAKQWKTFYNTAKGRGTVKHFLEIVHKYG